MPGVRKNLWIGSVDFEALSLIFVKLRSGVYKDGTVS